MGWQRIVVLDWDLQQLQLVQVDHLLHVRGRVLLRLFLQVQVLVLRCRVLLVVLQVQFQLQFLSQLQLW